MLMLKLPTHESTQSNINSSASSGNGVTAVPSISKMSASIRQLRVLVNKLLKNLVNKDSNLVNKWKREYRESKQKLWLLVIIAEKSSRAKINSAITIYLNPKTVSEPNQDEKNAVRDL